MFVKKDMYIVLKQVAFYEGEWGRMNARDRGTLMYR